MGRWTQYDEDQYRLNGLRRVAYDADTQTYVYADENGQQYLGVPGSQYEIASPLRDDPASDRPQAFDTGRPKPRLDVKSLPTTFQDFLPASAITTPTAKASASSSSSGFFDAARRAALPKIAGVVDGIKRSATTAQDGKRRNPLASSASRKDEKKVLERSATAPWKPSWYHKEEKQAPPPLPEVSEKQRLTTMGLGQETFGSKHSPPARKPVPAFSSAELSQGQLPLNDEVPPPSSSSVSRGRQMKRAATQVEKRDASVGEKSSS